MRLLPPQMRTIYTRKITRIHRFGTRFIQEFEHQSETEPSGRTEDAKTNNVSRSKLHIAGKPIRIYGRPLYCTTNWMTISWNQNLKILSDSQNFRMKLHFGHSFGIITSVRVHMRTHRFVGSAFRALLFVRFFLLFYQTFHQPDNLQDCTSS